MSFREYDACYCPVCNKKAFITQNFVGYVAHASRCKACRGAGVCPNCDGKSLDPGGPDCPVCENEGVCVECWGRGKTYA